MARVNRGRAAGRDNLVSVSSQGAPRPRAVVAIEAAACVVFLAFITFLVARVWDGARGVTAWLVLVTNGWANRWLDGLRVFERLEAGLVALGVPATDAE